MESIDVRLSAGNFNRISRRTNLDRRHVGRVLRGVREPTFDVARMIAEAAGVSLDELWEWTAKFRRVRTAEGFVDSGKAV